MSVYIYWQFEVALFWSNYFRIFMFYGSGMPTFMATPHFVVNFFLAILYLCNIIFPLMR